MSRPEIVDLDAELAPHHDTGLVVGHRYLYTEDADRFEVVVLEDVSTEEFLTHRVQVTKVIRGKPKHAGKSYVLSMKRGIAFAGMWRLHPLEN